MNTILLLLLFVSISQSDIEPENRLNLNVWNQTTENVFIYHNETLLFSLKAGDKKERYILDKSIITKIYARTYDSEYKWGPIDLKETKKVFYWKLTLPKQE